MLQFLIWVTHFTFLDFEIGGIFISFNMCLKNGFVKSCFQQSAKRRMTAQTERKHHVFCQNLTSSLYLPSKP